MMSNIIKIHLFKNARIGITADTGVAFFCQREDYKFEVRYYLRIRLFSTVMLKSENNDEPLRIAKEQVSTFAHIGK